MLAAETARTVLQAEHAQLRLRIDEIAALVERDERRHADPALDELRQRIRALQAFDRTTHRPKGIALIAALRGRSAESDQLIAEIEGERAHDDAMLAQVLAGLQALASGDTSALDECEALLGRYRDRVLRQLDDEDLRLLAHAARLLTQPEWSSIASSISSVMYPEGERPPD